MLRRPTSDRDPADWFAFAAERIRAADVLHQHEGVTGAGIELLQESVERYLNGYLIARGWRLVRTHDLTLLFREAACFDPGFSAFIPMAEELTEDFFAQHYPGEDTSLVGQNYGALRAQTAQVIDRIQLSLPQHFLPPPSDGTKASGT